VEVLNPVMRVNECGVPDDEFEAKALEATARFVGSRSMNCVRSCLHILKLGSLAPTHSGRTRPVQAWTIARSQLQMESS
jgi:hypothetical protein